MVQTPVVRTQEAFSTDMRGVLHTHFLSPHLPAKPEAAFFCKGKEGNGNV